MPPRLSPADFPPGTVAQAVMWRGRNREPWSLEWCCVVYADGERRAWMPGHEGWSVEAHVAQVANIVQDAIVESRTAWADPWPRCPSHGTHPMAAGMRDGVAIWTCTADESVAIRIGDLPRA